MKKFAAVLIGMVVTTTAFAKCEGMSLKEMTPTKFSIYHTDKSHKTASDKAPIKYEVDHDELSDSETLMHISHHKNKDKMCQIFVSKEAEKFTLKQKEDLIVKGAEFVDNKFTMKLDHPKLTSIVCTGVSTLQDLKDTMEPYLMFSCKDKMAYNKPAAAPADRLPASVPTGK